MKPSHLYSNPFSLVYVLFMPLLLFFLGGNGTTAYIQPFQNPHGQQKSTLLLNCPPKCECESSASSSSSVGDQQQLSPTKQSIYCDRGGLNDTDLLQILQSIQNPLQVQVLEIKAPVSRPNSFQWNDNLNRFGQLRRLVLSNCGIPALSQTIRLPSLVHLDLSGNRIDQLQIGSFIGMPALESLDFSRNLMQSLPTGAFLYLKHLRRLSLSHNRLKELSASLLRGPQSLQELELDGNQLNARQLNELFTDLSHLTRLELNNCGLSDLQVEELQLIRVPELRRLGLASNNLTNVPSISLRVLEHLDTLDMRHNKIRVLGPCAFCACNISRVLLGHNLLGLTPAAISLEAFADTKMHELDLSFNFLDQFDSMMLHHAMDNLKILHLSGNSLPTFHDRLLHTLPSLTHLHLAYNMINHIPFTLPRGYAYLKFLNLSANHLDELPSNLAGLLPELTVLDISHNKFTSLSTTVVNSFIEGLDQVYLHDNPWDCQCAVQNLQQYMLQRLSYRTVLNYERTVCAKPPLLKGRPLHRVQKINDCAVLFGASYGLTQASELLLLLAALLVAAFLVSVIVIILLYCGREHKQKAVFVTRDHSRTQLTTHPLDIASAGGSTNSGTAPSSLMSEPLMSSPTALLLQQNGESGKNHSGSSASAKKKNKMPNGHSNNNNNNTNGMHSTLLGHPNSGCDLPIGNGEAMKPRKQKSPPPPGSMFVTF